MCRYICCLFIIYKRAEVDIINESEILMCRYICCLFIQESRSGYNKSK